jgi:uncharacterized protein
MLVRFFLLFLAAISLHAEPLPELKTPVTDLTGTLSKEQISNLENRILGLEKEKGSQIAIAIVPTTSAENIEQYSIRLATAWKIGRKGVDDGVLLVVAKQDRKLRIEVGYGLEGAIPDAYAKQIIDMTIVPRLREGKFYEGISDGLDRIISLIKTESLPPAQKEKAIPRMSNTEWMLAVLIHGGFWLRPALLVLGVILFIWKRDLKGLVIPLGIWLAWILFWSLRVQAFFFSGLISAAVYSLVYYFFQITLPDKQNDAEYKQRWSQPESAVNQDRKHPFCIRHARNCFFFLRWRQRLRFDQRNDSIESVADALIEFSFAEARHNRHVYDLFRVCIRNGTFQSVAHFYAQFTILFGYNQQHSIVYTLPADFPCSGQPDRILFYVFRGCGRNNCNGDLASLFLFQAENPVFQV